MPRPDYAKVWALPAPRPQCTTGPGLNPSTSHVQGTIPPIPVPPPTQSQPPARLSFVGKALMDQSELSNHRAGSTFVAMTRSWSRVALILAPTQPRSGRDVFFFPDGNLCDRPKGVPGPAHDRRMPGPQRGLGLTNI